MMPVVIAKLCAKYEFYMTLTKELQGKMYFHIILIIWLNVKAQKTQLRLIGLINQLTQIRSLALCIQCINTVWRGKMLCWHSLYWIKVCVPNLNFIGWENIVYIELCFFCVHNIFSSVSPCKHSHFRWEFLSRNDRQIWKAAFKNQQFFSQADTGSYCKGAAVTSACLVLKLVMLLLCIWDFSSITNKKWKIYIGQPVGQLSWEDKLYSNIKQHMLYCFCLNDKDWEHSYLKAKKSIPGWVWVLFKWCFFQISASFLKMQVKCFLYSRIWKSSKNQEDCRLPIVNIFSGSRVLKV